MAAALKRIPLDRRVCVVREDRIDVRPERAALVGPLVGLAISLALYVAVAVFSGDLSALALAAMLVPGLILGPFSAMALIHSLLGAKVVIDGRKQSVTFQQGVLGLGLATAESVSFSNIKRLEVQDLSLEEVEGRRSSLPLDLRAWDVVLVKGDGEQHSIGQVISASNADLIDEGFDRAVDVAEAVGALAGRPVVITAAVEEPGDEAITEPTRDQAGGPAAEPVEGSQQP